MLRNRNFPVDRVVKLPVCCHPEERRMSKIGSHPPSERFLLIVAALAASLAAWATWHFLGQESLSMLLLVALIAALADNWRLRRAARRPDSGDGPQHEAD
jgi:hypothetical protein